MSDHRVHDHLIVLHVYTHKPSKWRLVDTETGEVYEVAKRAPYIWVEAEGEGLPLKRSQQQLKDLEEDVRYWRGLYESAADINTRVGDK